MLESLRKWIQAEMAYHRAIRQLRTLSPNTRKAVLNASSEVIGKIDRILEYVDRNRNISHSLEGRGISEPEAEPKRHR